MAIQIPNLWPVKQVQVDVLTPLAILRTQASNLNQLTQGILVGKVSTLSNEETVQHHLDVLVPALNNYTHRLLSVTHAKDRAYPVTVQAEYCNDPLMALSNGCQSFTQEQFIDLLKDVLESKHVISILQSLIAQSNESRDESDTGILEER